MATDNKQAIELKYQRKYANSQDLHTPPPPQHPNPAGESTIQKQWNKIPMSHAASWLGSTVYNRDRYTHSSLYNAT